jgi:hypothetical protein
VAKPKQWGSFRPFGLEVAVDAGGGDVIMNHPLLYAFCEFDSLATVSLTQWF